jgi:hypothetical protein
MVAYEDPDPEHVHGDGAKQLSPKRKLSEYVTNAAQLII